MKISIDFNIETKHIHAYLIELGLFRLSIKEHDFGFHIVVGTFPDYIDKSYFSEVSMNDDLSWTLLLKKEDIMNVNVTRRFFHKSANHSLI